MAEGPDPNRHFETDPELSGEEEREGAGLGDPSSSRLGLSSWAVGVLAVVLVALFVLLMR
jgi:hypothetical protein